MCRSEKSFLPSQSTHLTYLTYLYSAISKFVCLFRVTATKYSDMQQITANIAKGITQLNEKYRELQPYLDQIDQVNS